MNSERTEDSTLLEVNELSLTIDGNKKLFHDVNFRVHEGDILILQGKSGSG